MPGLPSLAMHPIERLRWVARAPDGEASLMAAEAAEALASFADEPAGLVTACRRLIERRPSCGPLWWVSARMLCSLDAALEAHLCAADLERDPTPARLAAELPGGAVAVAGWPEQSIIALRGRARLTPEVPADDRVYVAGGREAQRLMRWFDGSGLEARIASPENAARRSVLVLLEAEAVGPGGFVAAAGSGALARAAQEAGRPVWLVAGVGRVLPAPLYEALVGRVGDASPVEVLPLELVEAVAGPGGVVGPAAATSRPGCPVAPELLRFRG